MLCYHAQTYLNTTSHTVYDHESESKSDKETQHIHICKFNSRCMQPSCEPMSSRIFKSQMLCVLDLHYLINKWFTVFDYITVSNAVQYLLVVHCKQADC